jgi:hypothetical protein
MIIRGKCDTCGLLYVWERKHGQLRSAYCSLCQGKLKRTSYQLKRYDHTSALPLFKSYYRSNAKEA